MPETKGFTQAHIGYSMGGHHSDGGAMHLSHLTGAPGAFALCLTLAAVPPARAEAPLARHFGAENRCYGIRFPEAHMAAHPDQQLRAIRLDHFPGSSGSTMARAGFRSIPTRARS
ncbi:MAG: hypothetical protein R3D85_04500 [Paracoccaceae bacterium]